MDSLAFLVGSSLEIAPRLIGCILERELDGVMVRVRIVETEAYGETDAASLSFKGRTERTRVMFGPAGYLYVYFTYGMHYCCNIVVGAPGYGAAVLIRAVEPLDGTAILQANRHGTKGISLTNGPAKTCQALAIDKSLNGHDLRRTPLQLVAAPALPKYRITQTKRVGISQAKDVPWRFYETANMYVSKQ